MAGSATLTIKVGANVKDAAQQLQALGYNIENVKKKTDSANQSASIWDKTLQKTSENNINKVIELGSKYLSLATAINVATNAAKKLFVEGTKYNSELAKQIDDMESAWDKFVGAIGSALLTTLRPAIEWVTETLNKLNRMFTFSNGPGDMYANIRYAASRGESLDSYSDSQLEAALNSTKFKNIYGTYNNIIDVLEKEIAARKENAKSIEATTEAVETLATTISDSREAIVKSYKDQQEKVLSYSSSYKTATEIDELRSLAEFAQGGIDETPKGDQYSTFYQEALDAINKQIELLENGEDKWEEYFSLIQSGAKETFTQLSNLSSNWFELRETELENSALSEEEKAEELDKLARREFVANQINATAEATMSYAQGVIDIWTKYASMPTMAGILTGLLAANTGVQFATIASQRYTGLAEGGIVQSPTRALIGEGAEKEAVIPLSKLEDFVDKGEGGVINLSISVNGNASADDVYYAIERAQRTGLLPRWRYA